MEDAKILIVDDEPANVQLLERILAKANFTRTSRTLDSRLVADIVESDPPDLILLDLHMPHLDGFAVLQQLQTVIPASAFLPILVLTADVSAEAKLRALSSGATDFLTKPFDRGEVILRVRNLLRTRALHLQVQTQTERMEAVVQQRALDLQLMLRELETTQQQVIQQERLHALGLMASGVAHDFNNALSIILGFGELLLLDSQSIPAAQHMSGHLQTVIAAAADAAGMVSRLREFYRPGDRDEPRVAVDLNALIEQAITLTRPKWSAQALSAGIAIEVTADLTEIPPVKGAAAELREVLTNLIFNAVDALPTGGTVTLTTLAEADGITLSIADTGIGMSEEVRRRCLEPFFTTKGNRGTGLGLSMVHGIVERHGGTLEIATEPGRGTAFTIRLPAMVAASGSGDLAPAALDRPLTILVADDQPVIRKIIGDYLERDWHTVETAGDGREALTKFITGEYDLVLTDLAMPEMNGQLLAAAVKEISPGTPVILLTAFGELANQDGADAKGVDLVLSKPVSPSALRQAIARVMAK